MVSRYSVLLQFFNFMGILSCRISSSQVEVSIIHVVLNILKNMTLFFSKNHIINFVLNNNLPVVSKMRFSYFTKTMRRSSPLQPFYFGALTIFLQQINASRHSILINDMLTFRKHLENRLPETKDLFKNFGYKCLKRFATITIIISASCLVGFFYFFHHTLPLFLVFMLSQLPLFINLSCAWYYYIIMQFLLCCQEVLLLRALELKQLDSYHIFSQIISDLESWQSTLYSIKERFMSITSCVMIPLMFFFVNRIVLQVST